MKYLNLEGWEEGQQGASRGVNQTQGKRLKETEIREAKKRDRSQGKRWEQ